MSDIKSILPSNIWSLGRESVARLRGFRPFRSDAVWALFDQGFVSLCNFATVFLIARYAPSEDLGLFVLLYSILLLATDMQHAALTKAHNVLVPRLSTRESHAFTSVLFELQVGGAAIVAVILGAASIIFFAFDIVVVAQAVYALAIASAPWLIQDAIRRVMYTSGDARSAFKNDAISYGLQAGSIGILLTVFDGDVAGFYFIIGISSAIAVAYGVWQLRSQMPVVRPSSPVFRSISKRIWSFSRWLTGSEILYWIGRHGNVWILGAIAGIGPVGTYKAVMQLTNVLNPIKLATFTYLPSRASRMLHGTGKHAFHRWLFRTGGLILIPYSIVVFSLVFFSSEILHFAYNGHYDGRGLAVIVSLGAIAHLLYFIRSLVQVDLLTRGRTSAIFTDSFLSVLMLLSVGLVSIRYLGIMGAVVFEVIMASSLILYNVLVFYGVLDPGDTQKSDSTRNTSRSEMRQGGSQSLGRLIDRGSEALVYLSESGDNVVKVFSDPDYPKALTSACREFETLIGIDRRKNGVGCVDLPKPVRLLENLPGIEMTRLRGMPLLDLLACRQLTSDDISSVALKLYAGVLYVTALLEGPYRDFSVRNVLLDTDTGRLSFLDFGPGQWHQVKPGRMSNIVTSLGHFTGGGLYQLARPEFVANGLIQKQMPALCSALLIELMSSDEADSSVINDLHRFMGDKYDEDTRQGSLIRRSWYAAIGNTRFRKHVARIKQQIPRS